MDFHRQEAKLHSSEDYEYDVDDDVFYDELRRQVLQLTAEDDDAVVCEAKIMLEARNCKQGPHRLVHHPICYHGWPGIKDDSDAAPAWMLNLWRTGNGTGVFIPRGVQSRRRSNRSRRKNDKGRANRQFVRTN